MWGQTRPRATAEARTLDQIDMWVHATVQEIFASRNIPETWEGVELQAIVFEVAGTGEDGTMYGYHYWLNGIESSWSDGIVYFTPSILQQWTGMIPFPGISVEDLAGFLAGLYGTQPIIRRYAVSPEGEVAVVEA